MLQVLKQYGIDPTQATIEKFGSGLINNTWLVNYLGASYILQRVNADVFKDPLHIAHNMDLLAAYFKSNFPEYLFVSPVLTVAGDSMIKANEHDYYRLILFVANSRSVDVVSTPAEAYAAAAQFGRFTRLLSGFDASQLATTIPDFHNLSLRYSQFLQALHHGKQERILATTSLINFIKTNAWIVDTYEEIKKDERFLLRVTHHDTKISNVLFDEHGNGLCVIDLDTVMPGYFISDVGDMMRTYLSPVSEEEADFEKIEVREDFYEAIVAGYFDEMKDVMTTVEIGHFYYAGLFMIYMQAVRFLTDHLLGDPYYGAKYVGHNLVRANNQVVLLQKMLEKRSRLEKLSLSIAAK